MSHIVIVGAGECGARAAFALREKGFEGEISLIGAEPHLPYERPPLSKDGLAGAEPPKYVAGPDRYEEARIAVLTSVTVEAIDRRRKAVRLADGRSIDYDRLLLATGARPRPLPDAPENAERVRMLRTHADALGIRSALAPGRKLAIVGGGFVGLELAATARKLGAEVVLIEGLPRVLSRGVPEDIATIVTERHRQEGVEIICGARIAALEADDIGARVHFADGASRLADLIVVGIGAVPNTQLAEAAGILVETASPSTRRSGPQIPISMRLATAAPFRCRTIAAGVCGSRPGATRRTREHS